MNFFVFAKIFDRKSGVRVVNDSAETQFFCKYGRTCSYFFYYPINIHGPFFWRIWLKHSRIARHLEFRFFIFLRKKFSFKFYIFQGFCRINTTFYFSMDFHIFLLSFAVVLLNSNLLKFLKYLYPFLSYAKNILFYFLKIILNLT